MKFWITFVLLLIITVSMAVGIKICGAFFYRNFVHQSATVPGSQITVEHGVDTTIIVFGPKGSIDTVDFVFQKSENGNTWYPILVDRKLFVVDYRDSIIEVLSAEVEQNALMLHIIEGMIKDLEDRLTKIERCKNQKQEIRISTQIDDLWWGILDYSN